MQNTLNSRCKSIDNKFARSQPALSVENYNPALISQSSEFVLLVGDVLQGVYATPVQDGVVVPEALGVGERSSVVVAHRHCVLLDVGCLSSPLPLNA
jgi:hypothetical protein